jgi:hypothetical protein
MSYFIFIVLTAIVFIIIKFVYDSYLTNRTEESWRKFEASDPQIASEIINSTFGMKSVKQNLELGERLGLIKNELVLERLEASIMDYQLESLQSIKNKFGGIKGDFAAIIEATDLLIANTENCKIELLKQKDEIGLSEEVLVKVIEDVFRSLIQQEIGVDLSTEVKPELTKTETISIVKKRTSLSEGINKSVIVNKVEFEKYSNEALVYLEAYNNTLKTKMTSYFVKSEYVDTIDCMMKFYVNKKMGVELEKCKLVDVFCEIKENDVVIRDLILNTEIF